MKSSVSIGIDLGTTYSCVGVWQGTKVDIIEDSAGRRTVPSWVSFIDGNAVVGHAAKDLRNTNVDNTVYDVKRILGRKVRERELKDDKYNFLTKESPSGFAEICVNGRKYSPEEISGLVLSHLKSLAENYLKTEVKDAVITVPAYFNDSQRQATKAAGSLAGLNVIRIINEPTAAAMAYGFETKDDEGSGKIILVFDLGGGTFDVSLLSLSGGIYEVMATSGNSHLGGEDFDNVLVRWILDQAETRVRAESESGAQMKIDAAFMDHVRAQAEFIKISLSSELFVSTNVNAKSELGEEVCVSLCVTRTMFDEMCDELFKKCIGPVERVLSDAKAMKSDVDEVVLVGGSTRIPRIKDQLREMFGGKTLNCSVNPDEAVAYGAAVQAAILTGQRDDSGKLDSTVLIDVTPLSLGLETAGGLMTVLIPRNTSVPAKKVQMFSTNDDYQTSVMIKVYEGERGLVRNNHLLGQFELGPVPKMLRGQPQIEIAFEIDENCILNITAKETITGLAQSIRVSNEFKNATDMIKDGEANWDADNEVRHKIVSKNDLEFYCYTMRNSIRTFSDQEYVTGLISEGLKVAASGTADECVRTLTGIRNYVKSVSEKGSTSIEDLLKQEA